MTFITDRTESDSLLKNAKGVYHFYDLNRVEKAVAKIQDMALRMDIHLGLETKTDWGVPGAFPLNFPTESQMARYLSNVRAIRDTFGISTQLPQSMRRLDWKGANNIEKVLQEALTIVEGTVNNYRYCGELFAGEE